MLARVRLLANVRMGLCMHVSRHHSVEAPPCVQYARTVHKFSLMLLWILLLAQVWGPYDATRLPQLELACYVLRNNLAAWFDRRA